MPIDYKIVAKQKGIEKKYLGTVEHHDELQLELQKVYTTFVKGYPASVELSYKEETEEQKALEREKIRKIVKEEFEKMKKDGELD